MRIDTRRDDRERRDQSARIATSAACHAIGTARDCDVIFVARKT
jgi:hypothetical protein